MDVAQGNSVNDQRVEPLDPWCERINRRFDELTALILADGERTRRHFDVVIKRLMSEIISPSKK